MSGATTNHAFSSTLDEVLKLRDSQKSTDLYNTLPDDHSQPHVAQDTTTAPADLFVYHDTHKVFGVYLVHGHFKAPGGTVLIGKSHDDASLRWVNTVLINGIDLSNVHGYIYMATGYELCPYELQHGPLPELLGVDERFLGAFENHIARHNLRDLLALQVLGSSKGPMMELGLNQGTVMVSSRLVRNVTVTRIIGWRFHPVDGRPPSPKATELHVQKKDGHHMVFDSGASQPKLGSVEELKVALTAAGVMAPRP